MNGSEKKEVLELMVLTHHGRQNVVSLEKGKPSERAGRKATGLSPRGDRGDRAAGSPSECSIPRAGYRGHKEILSEVVS